MRRCKLKVRQSLSLHGVQERVQRHIVKPAFDNLILSEYDSTLKLGNQSIHIGVFIDHKAEFTRVSNLLLGSNRRNI